MEGRDVRFLAIHPFNRREECENKGSVLSSAAKRIWSGNTVGKERKRKREFGSDGIRGRIFLPPIRRMKYEEFGIKQPHKTRIILNVFFFFFSSGVNSANLYYGQIYPHQTQNDVTVSNHRLSSLSPSLSSLFIPMEFLHDHG